jgi:tryptophan halogenase
VALGLAAGFMEPLESTSIHLVQSALARLLNVLPGSGGDSAAARDTFNRLSAIEWARVRDFITLHYFANRREGPFWDYCRNMEIPETLREKIELFREAGLFMREEDELFLDDSWGQVMIGQGIMPERWSPLADNVPGEDIGPFLDSLANSYRVRAESLPTHREFVASMVGDRVEERQ